MHPDHRVTHFCHVKVTFFWDNGHIESFRTLKGNVKEDDSVLVIDDGGSRKAFSKRYLRRVDMVEE